MPTKEFYHCSSTFIVLIQELFNFCFVSSQQKRQIVTKQKIRK